MTCSHLLQDSIEYIFNVEDQQVELVAFTNGKFELDGRHRGVHGNEKTKRFPDGALVTAPSECVLNLDLARNGSISNE